MTRSLLMSTLEDRANEVNLYLSKFITKSPKIARFLDEPEESCIDIAIWENMPSEGLATILTIDLSYHPLFTWDGEPYTKERVELMAVCGIPDIDFMTSIMSTCAFCVINSKWFSVPGSIFHDVVSMYDNKLNMKHILFDFPWIHAEFLSTANIGGVQTRWLMVVPISESEFQYAIEVKSANALSEKLDENHINICDFNRPSVI